MSTALADAIERPLGTRRPYGAGGGLPESAETRFIDPRLDETWDALVLKHPEHTFFHSAAWASVLCRSYGHRPFYLKLYERGKVLALFPLLEVSSRLTGRRAVCLPFSDYCGPLAFGDLSPRLLDDEVAETARARKWKYVELRASHERRDADSGEPTFYGHQLALTSDLDQMVSGFDASVRRALRKAERSPLTVQISSTRKSVTEFFDLHMKTRRRHGVPPQSISFFYNIHDTIFECGLGFVVQASLGARPVATAMFFHFGKGAIYKFGASDAKFHEHRGNNLVMWEGIKELARRGAEHLHFGRTSCDNHGLRRYKCAWGAKEEPINYLRLHPPSGRWTGVNGHASGFHERFFRRMPLALNRLAGTLLYPHLH